MRGDCIACDALLYFASFYRRMAALQERESHGATHTDVKHKGPAPGKGQYKGMSKADVEIQQRLEKLREKSPKEGKVHKN